MDYSKSRGQRYRDRAINSNKDGWSIENQNAMDAEKERQKQEEEKRKEQDWIDRGVTNPNHKNTNFWFDRLRHQIKKEVENRFFIYKNTKKVYIATSKTFGNNSKEKRKKAWEGYQGDYRDYPREKSTYYANEARDKGKVSVQEFVDAGATGKKVHYYHEDNVEKWARIHYKHHEGKMPKDMEHYDITEIVKGNPGVSPDGGDVSEDGGVSPNTIQVDVGPDAPRDKDGAGRRRRRRKKTRKKRRKSRRIRKSRRKSKKSRRKRRRTRRRRR